MDIGVEIGQKFRASFPKFENDYIECRLLSTTIENEGQGTIKIETLKRSGGTYNINNTYYKAGECISIVEELWFNVPDSRVITIID
jgi:hypothetical protein